MNTNNFSLEAGSSNYNQFCYEDAIPKLEHTRGGVIHYLSMAAMQ